MQLVLNLASQAMLYMLISVLVLGAFVTHLPALLKVGQLSSGASSGPWIEEVIFGPPIEPDDTPVASDCKKQEESFDVEAHLQPEALHEQATRSEHQHRNRVLRL